MLAALRASFAFLTILISGRIFTNDCIKKSTFFYPIVGIVLGLILSYSSLLFLRLSNSPALAGVIYLILSFILTRGLHHDGLADVSDAWGSCARGEKFRIILKDSRIGSFGTIILILYFFLCYTAISNILSIQLMHDLIQYPSQNIFSMPPSFYSNVFYLLFLAPIWGRVGLLLQPAFDMPYVPIPTKNENNIVENSAEKIAKQCNLSSDILDNTHNPTVIYTSVETQESQKSPIPQNYSNEQGHNSSNNSDVTLPTSLSQNMVHPFQKSRFFLWFFISIIIFSFFTSPTRLIFILILSLFVFLGFYSLSKRENGYNGDFLGAQCLCFELIVFLSIYV